MNKLKNLVMVLLCVYSIVGMATDVCFVVESAPGSPSTICSSSTLNIQCCDKVCRAAGSKNYDKSPEISAPQKQGTTCSQVYPNIQYFVGDSYQVNVDGGHVAVCHCR